MRNARSLLAAVLLALGATPALAQDAVLEGGGIVYGGKLGVGVQAPKGWLFDSQSGTEQGLNAVVYPEGSTWSDSQAVMYVKIASLSQGQTLDQFIDGDVASLREQSPNLQVRVGDPLHLSAGTPVEVRFYSNDSWGNHEAVAYVASGGDVALYVLSSRTQESFDASLQAFKTMVSSSFLAKMAFEK